MRSYTVSIGRRRQPGGQDRMTPVIGDAQTPFFGALIEERTLLPGPDAHLGRHTMAQWLKDR
ncbi:hypothetical protein QF037_009697 [Streptomyces canus]|uniref:hypothetical protein n=1 Tax=Streptomyces canus TaxID=58343 RepID=UPI00278701B5|nr:hypothetical protein [Streptomyces canus]MDQ0605352.1 hypothetical protein [Streptomyces canus]